MCVCVFPFSWLVSFLSVFFCSSLLWSPAGQLHHIYHNNLRWFGSIIFRRKGKKPMEEPHSVNSPRTILSFSKRGRTTTASVSFVDPNDEKSNSGEHGPKPSEVYGFVGSITTVVATGPNLVISLLFYHYIVFYSCYYLVVSDFMFISGFV